MKGWDSSRPMRCGSSSSPPALIRAADVRICKKSHCADSQIADKSFDLIANTLNREVHRWRPTREAFSSSLSAVISEWPGAVKGMILFVMAKLPLTARTIRGQLSSRKRPPTAERNHCKQSRRSNLLVLTPVSTLCGAANPGCRRLSAGVPIRHERPPHDRSRLL